MAKLAHSKRQRAKKRIVIESLIALLLVLSPFIFKIHIYFPDSETYHIGFLGIDIESNGFIDVNTYVWFLIGKIVPLYLLVLWFLTSRDWWYHLILIPIAMYAFQLFEVIFSNSEAIDTANLLWLLPICMVVVPFVYLIRIKLYDKYVHGIDLDAMEAELQELKSKPELKTDAGEAKETPSSSNDFQEPKSLSEKIDQKLSTGNIENMLRHWQHRLENWLHLKF